MRYLLIFMVFLLSCSKSERKLTIAAASNMRYALAEITDQFELESGIDTQTIVASSGKLTAQIMDGAPYDVFLSADARYPKLIQKGGKSLYPHRIYASGKLTVWSTVEINAIEDLKRDEFEKIALPNPKLAPYGKAAVELMEKLGIYAEIKHKFVFGESVSQTNQFISTGVVQAGFTSQSIQYANSDWNGSWMNIEPILYTRIAQSAVIIDHEDSHANSQIFFDFLFSKKAAQILKKYGYIVESE